MKINSIAVLFLLISILASNSYAQKSVTIDNIDWKPVPVKIIDGTVQVKNMLTAPVAVKIESGNIQYGSPKFSIVAHLIKGLDTTNNREMPSQKGPFLLLWASSSIEIHIPDTHSQTSYSVLAIQPTQIGNGIYIPADAWVEAIDAYVEGVQIIQ